MLIRTEHRAAAMEIIFLSDIGVCQPRCNEGDCSAGTCRRGTVTATVPLRGAGAPRAPTRHLFFLTFVISDLQQYG